MTKLEQAEVSYQKAISLKNTYTEALMNLSLTLTYRNKIFEAGQHFKTILGIDKNNAGLRAGVMLAIFKFLENDFKGSKELLIATSGIQKKLSPDFQNERIYHQYLTRILKWHDNNSIQFSSYGNDNILYVIGESHALINHQIEIWRSNTRFLCQAFWVLGCKQWHLGNSSNNEFKYKFESIVGTIPKSSDILLAIGEIDCRIDDGLLKHKKKYPQKNIKDLILITIQNYLNYIFELNMCYQHNIIIQGIPCPNLDTSNYRTEEVEELVNTIQLFNLELKRTARKIGFSFLDVHKLTDNGNGFSNGCWHIDNIHLSVSGMQEAWRRYGL
jgi:hypothetical protein